MIRNSIVQRNRKNRNNNSFLSALIKERVATINADSIKNSIYTTWGTMSKYASPEKRAIRPKPIHKNKNVIIL